MKIKAMKHIVDLEKNHQIQMCQIYQNLKFITYIGQNIVWVYSISGQETRVNLSTFVTVRLYISHLQSSLSVEPTCSGEVFSTHLYWY